MKTNYAATIALVLATLGTSQAFAADTPATSLTRDQVLAELVQAQRTGDVIDSHSGKKLNELFPASYPAKAAASAKTRDQVLAELIAAERSGDIANEHGVKANELLPHLYPAKAASSSKSHDQVLAELVEAQRTGDIVDVKSTKKLNELFPSNYPTKS